jgi:cytochrome c-type biogenesis protein
MEDISITTMYTAILAGILSVASPCVFPVIPIIVTGKKDDSIFRPTLIVLGISITFILMGVLSSLFGYILAGKMRYIEYVAGAFISIMGILMVFDINPFKKLTLFNNINSNFNGAFSGLLLGLTLGLIWIPCIGPMLSSILTTVATDGKILTGITLLALYSLGFSVPMLIIGHSSLTFRQKIKTINKHTATIRVVSGLILTIFGAYIAIKGAV